MTTPSPCPHLQGGRLETLLLLDAWLGIAEAVTRCPLCGQCSLLELLDIDGNRRAWRLTPLDTGQAAGLVRDVNRGSCDVHRAGNQLHALRASHALPAQVVISEDGSLTGLRLGHGAGPLPSTSWRELPLDGQWLRPAG